MKGGTWLAVFVLLMPFVLGATIHGKVFDYNFALANNSVIRINTVPEQVVVAVDGSYLFNIPIGEYILSAELKDELGRITYSLEDNISVLDDRDYVRDLIMFPNNNLSELDIENNVTTPSLPDNVKVGSQKSILLLTGLVLIIIFAWIYCTAFKKCKWKAKLFPGKAKDKEISASEAKASEPVEEPEDELAGVADFIKKNKRVTQKDIRKQFPMSEAKISLMLTDLESQGKIRKIKKGRGNVVVWEEK
jgi:uncharacterized membrane protein